MHDAVAAWLGMRMYHDWKTMRKTQAWGYLGFWFKVTSHLCRFHMKTVIKPYGDLLYS